MLRAIIWMLASILLITFLKGVIGLIMKGMGQLFEGERQTAQQQQPASPAGFGGELVKDPVCGIFVPPASALTKKVRGEAYYFCSPECRDKYG